MFNSESIATLCINARNLLKKFRDVKVEHIDRSLNKICDKLSKDYILSTINNLNTHNFYIFFSTLNRKINDIFC